MRQVNCTRIRMVLIGFVAAIVVGGGNARADFTFGVPTLFDEPVNSPGIEYFDCISADGLEVYIEKPVSGGITASDWDLYVSTRESINDQWSVPANLGHTINSSGVIDSYACLSSDGLELYFSGYRPGGYGGQDIWVTKRPYRGADWGTPVNLGGPINTSYKDWLPWITRNGLELYFSSERPGGYGGSDIWVARRTATNTEWQEPVNLGPVVNSTISDCYQCISPDGLLLFFSDYDNPSLGFRSGGYGLSDMWMTRRRSTADPWEEPVNLGPDMNTSGYDSQPRISPDGSVLYFTSSRPESRTVSQNADIWQVPIIPIADFNGDGNIDTEDLLIMIDNWGSNEMLCDIGPMPWGDGIVDEADLEVLMSYWGQEAYDPGLIAHWKLDETEGNIAYDSAKANDATVFGDPVWQPEGGMADGSIALDGVDDYLEVSFVLNPADGPFSVFAWIKGGAPSQVVLSQAGATNWLCTDAAEGSLMTGLVSQAGRSPTSPLVSQAMITDDNWHRIGFVWDSSCRHVYVDGVEVAQDAAALDPLQSATGGLYIGTAKNLDAATFFSGLIDDVRIYSRAVNP